MKLFGIVGHPIAHSLSPLMHNTAFKLLGLEYRYDAFDVEPVALSDAMKDFREEGFSGLNVTIPHKEAMFDLVDEIEESAQLVGAVNTVCFTDGKAKGYNTDVHGVIKSLEMYKQEIDGKVILLIGAGGSARAVVYAVLSKFAPAELVIVTRTVSRAEDLVKRFSSLTRTTITTMSTAQDSFSDALQRASVVINATPVGMSPNVNNSPLLENAPIHDKQIFMDLIYSPLETALLKRAASIGARTISGLEMFLHQGARAFEIWTGEVMPLNDVRRVVLERLKRQAG